MNMVIEPVHAGARVAVRISPGDSRAHEHVCQGVIADNQRADFLRDASNKVTC